MELHPGEQHKPLLNKQDVGGNGHPAGRGKGLVDPGNKKYTKYGPAPHSGAIRRIAWDLFLPINVASLTGAYG